VLPRTLPCPGPPLTLHLTSLPTVCEQQQQKQQIETANAKAGKKKAQDNEREREREREREKDNKTQQQTCTTADWRTQYVQLLHIRQGNEWGHWSGRPSEARRDEDEGAGPEQQRQRGRIAGAHVIQKEQETKGGVRR
jgi:hypothetical protein